MDWIAFIDITFALKGFRLPLAMNQDIVFIILSRLKGSKKSSYMVD